MDVLGVLTVVGRENLTGFAAMGALLTAPAFYYIHTTFLNCRTVKVLGFAFTASFTFVFSWVFSGFVFFNQRMLNDIKLVESINHYDFVFIIKQVILSPFFWFSAIFGGATGLIAVLSEYFRARLRVLDDIEA